MIARQRLDLLLEKMEIPGRQLQNGKQFMTVNHWYKAEPLSDTEYMLKDAKGVLIGIFDSIDLEFE